ncbi:MAG: hypothetical protein K2N51_03925 [Lachnospiraceae bacterium]|nr:hypothetical protein [Lachnospiraceae bacterium]
MKKNILTIIIMALTVINVILTAVVLFSAVPAMNRTNNLIKKVTEIVDLELESGEQTDDNSVSIEDRENRQFNSSAGTLTINLQNSANGKAHWAQLDSVYVTVNKAGEDYKNLVKNLDGKGSDVLTIVSDVIGGMDYEAVSSKKSEMKLEIVRKLQEHFETESIIDVSFDNLRFQ